MDLLTWASPFVRQLALTPLSPLLSDLPKDASEGKHVRQVISIVLNAQELFHISTPLQGTLEELAADCGHDAGKISKCLERIYTDIDREIQRFHAAVESDRDIMFSNSPHPSPTSTVQGSSSQSVFPAWPFSMMPSEAPEGYDDFHLQLLERDDFRCCLSGQVDMPSVQTRQTPYQYQERYGFLDAAYMFPFSLRHHMAYLSRLTYPQDLFRLLARGSAINDTQNGILLERGMHSKFGEMWCIHALNDIYTFVSLSVGGVDSPPDGIFNFRAPKPNPILVNIHGMFAAAKAAMEASGTWKADGERNLVDKEDESAGLASPAMDTLVLGDPAVI